MTPKDTIFWIGEVKNVAMNKFVYAVAALLLTACWSDRSEDNVVEDRVVFETVDDVLVAYTTKGRNLDSATFIHSRVIGVPLDWFLLNFLDSAKGGEYVSLIRCLKNRVHDSTTIVFDKFREEGVLVVEDTPDGRYLRDPNFFGSVAFSVACLDPTSTKAAYYMEINCGNDCGGGFIVTAKLWKEKWRIEDIIFLWGGS
jgi:hypothetical protein